jgi:signal transduction histidine kinase
MLRLRHITLAAAALCISHTARPETAPLSTHAEAAALSDAEFAERRTFDVEALVVATYPNGTAFVRDESGFYEILFSCRHDLRPGMVVKIQGHTRYKMDSSRIRDLVGDSFTVVGKRPLPEPERITVDQLLHVPRPIGYACARGTIIDAFIDEIDSEWNYMILKDGENVAYVALAGSGEVRKRLSKLVDAEVEITGASFPGHAGFRIFIGPFLRLWDESCIRILKPAPEDPYSLPAIGDLSGTSPEIIASMGRRTATGTVIAVWGKGNILISSRGGNVMRVELADTADTPSYGDRVCVVGYPETDLYRINLVRAQFRYDSPEDAPREEPEDVTPERIMLDEFGRLMVKPNYHGRLVRMKGLVRALPSGAGDDRLLYMDCGRFLVPVDVSSNPGITSGVEIGCVVELTGVCVLESINWRPSMVFPRIDRMLLVPRSSDDIKVLSRPPWWTPGRLLAFIGALLAALAGILAWNLALRRLAERRGRELYRAEISKASAELRIDERTRLAAELHDAIAQNLTGVSMQIAAARSARTAAPEEEDRHLATADQMLRSSRIELRRCIWDLRSEALDIPNFEEAIRRTAQPVAGKACLRVQCDIQRSRLSDSTAHALLQIVRELTSNAVTHGSATEVSVVGTSSRGKAAISVRDNGTGFIPENCPGQNEGHFGLKGIRERVKRLDGTFSITSTIGGGTVATIEIRMS